MADSLFSFREIQPEDAETILKWRTSKRVTKFMHTDVPYDLELQKKWLSECFGKESYYHWFILHEGKPVGLLNLSDYSPRERTTSWGFYLGTEELRGLGAFLPPFFYNWAFERLGVREIRVEVFYNNLSVIEMHRLHGFTFDPARDRILQKSGAEILLVAMRLAENAWNRSKFKAPAQDFPVRRWNKAPGFLTTYR